MKKIYVLSLVIFLISLTSCWDSLYQADFDEIKLKATSPTSNGSDNVPDNPNEKWSDWLFIDSDKALQHRYSRVSGSGEGIYKIKIQYRINKTDAIYCNYSNCMGYVYYGGFYSVGGGSIDAEYRYYFPNEFVGNTAGLPGVYTQPQTVSIQIKTYPDGSKSIWDEDLQMPFAIVNGNRQQMYLADECVDNKLSNSNYQRCTGYGKGSSVTIQ